MSAQSNKSTSEEAKESNKLKTCPMCGNSGYILTEYHATDYTAHWVQCDCGAKGAECETNDNAIKAWNARPEEDRLKARIKELEGLLFDSYLMGRLDVMANLPEILKSEVEQDIKEWRANK